MPITQLGKTKTRKPDYQDPRWDIPLNENWELIAAQLETLVTGYRWVSGLDLTQDGGLDFTVSAGIIRRADDENISGGSSSVGDDTTQYIYVASGGGIVVSNTFDATAILPLYIVQSSGGTIVSVGDLRHKQVASGGGAGGLGWVVPEDGNLVVNGTFDADTDWIKDTGWTIGSGVASCDGTQGGPTLLTQEGVLEVGKTYMITYEITAHTSGAVLPYAGLNQGDSQSAVGTYSQSIECTDIPDFNLAGDSTWVGSIDNVTIYEVGAAYPDITAESGKGYPLYGGQTLILPANPKDNDQIGWKDYNNEFDKKEAFIDPNGKPIEQLGTNVMTLNTRGQGGTIVWIKDRWLITDVTDMGIVNELTWSKA